MEKKQDLKRSCSGGSHTILEKTENLFNSFTHKLLSHLRNNFR